MRKIIAILILIIVCFSTCEKDDFCVVNPVTPNLVLRFYDTNNRETKKNVTNLYVWAEGKDTITAFKGSSKDSIYIPLNSLATETIYNFSKNDVVNQFTIKYSPKEEYISRSCGYRVIFNDVSFSSNNTWITDFNIISTTIDNQNEAHVQIFH